MSADDDVVGLRALAEKATPGPWTALTTGRAGGDHWYICDSGEAIAWISANDGENEDQRQPDAEFIAAVSPDVVLALLDEITTLRAEVADRDARIEAALNEARASSVPLGMPEAEFYRAMLRQVESTLSVPAVPVPPTETASGLEFQRDAPTASAVPVPQDNPEATREQVGKVVWETSRADEGSISVTGANIVADAILAAFDVRLKNGEKP